MKLIGMTAVAAILLSSNAFSAGRGPDLYERCVGVKKDSIEDATCNLYLNGVSEGIYIAQIWLSTGNKFCLPIEHAPDVRQVRAIVEKFMKDHPEKLDAPASVVVAGALAVAFPCQDSN